MLTVETFIGPSKLHRLGLFAGQDIAQCTMVCHRHNLYDVKFSSVAYRDATIITRNVIDHYAFMFESVFDEHFAAEDYYTLFHDNGRFINHSSKPNLAYTNPLRLPGTLDVYYDVLIALRDIPSGDELTLDYNDCCPKEYPATRLERHSKRRAYPA